MWVDEEETGVEVILRRGRWHRSPARVFKYAPFRQIYPPSMQRKPFF